MKLFRPLLLKNFPSLPLILLPSSLLHFSLLNLSFLNSRRLDSRDRILNHKEIQHDPIISQHYSLE